METKPWKDMKDARLTDEQKERVDTEVAKEMNDIEPISGQVFSREALEACIDPSIPENEVHVRDDKGRTIAMLVGIDWAKDEDECTAVLIDLEKNTITPIES